MQKSVSKKIGVQEKMRGKRVLNVFSLFFWGQMFPSLHAFKHERIPLRTFSRMDLGKHIFVREEKIFFPLCIEKNVGKNGDLNFPPSFSFENREGEFLLCR